MLQSWRWFGPSDPVSLCEIRQAGVTDVVSSLHHIACGELWSDEEIAKRVYEIEWDGKNNKKSGLRWSIVESLPIHEDIKTRSGDYKRYIDIYKENIKRLGIRGVEVICYNFIPVFDWARTDLGITLEDGSTVSGCNRNAFVAFDLFILKRPNAEKDYPTEEIESAKKLYDNFSQKQRDELRDNILLGMPGTTEGLDCENLIKRLNKYRDIDEQKLRENLYTFLIEIIPTCEEFNVYMSIHPDDPAYPIFGVPRVMSTPADVAQLFSVVKSKNSGLTMCTGSFGSCISNNPAQMFEQFAARIYFGHFRNILHISENVGEFVESNHLYGSVDMPRVMKALITEEEKRRANGQKKWQIPVRPDHGKLMESDMNSGAYPGYSRTGRMIGLAELRGLECGIRHSMGLDIDLSNR